MFTPVNSLKMGPNPFLPRAAREFDVAFYACSSKASLSRPQMGQTNSSGEDLRVFYLPEGIEKFTFFGIINLIYLNLTTIFGKEKKGRRNEALSYESNFAAWKYIDT